MAGSNYEVNIKLNLKSVNKQLNNLEKRISRINKLAQGGRASRTVNKNEKDRLTAATKVTRQEQRTLRIKQKQLKVDQQQLKVEKQTATALQQQTKTTRISNSRPMGPSSPLNFTNQGTLLPGPGFGGSTSGGKAGKGFGGRLAGAGSSAIISGAFPLLFGQGPLIGAAGALGGGVGSLVGGQMGGFAGGLLATSIATPLQQLGIEAGKLGQALNPATKNVEALTAALGVTGTEFEKQLQTLKKLGGEEAAFEAARQKMVNLIGQDGVNALTKFGTEFTELGNNFAKIMTLMKASFANFLQNSGIGKFIATGVERTALLGQADASGQNLDTEEGRRIKELVGLRKRFTITGAGMKKEDADAMLEFIGRDKGRGAFGAANLIDANEARKLINDEIVALQKKSNFKDAELEAENMIKKIQESRIKNIDKEIALLERTRTMSSEEFEIEQQIMEMKKDGAIEDENAIRSKLQKLQLLEKERQLAEETAEAFKQMGQTIATDIADGIQGMIRGTSTLNDVLRNVLDKLIDASFNMAFFGNMQGSLGGGGGILGSIFKAVGGPVIGSSKNLIPNIASTPGLPSPPALPSPPVLPSTLKLPTLPSLPSSLKLPSPSGFPSFPGFKAEGGPVKRGGSFIVGERGPELFTPGVSGMITPNHALGGSTSIVVNVDASGSSVEGDEQGGRQLGLVLSAAIESELIKQKRPGGLLA